MAMITLPIPDTNNAKSTDEKVDLLLDSYYLLRKELEYGLFNLSFENMDNDTKRKFTDEFGNVAELLLNAEAVGARLSNAEGDITTLMATAQGITTRVSDAEGNISSLQQTANNITTRVSNAEGSISTLQQTATSISSTVSNHTQTINGMQVNISQIEQTATTISSTVASHTLSISGLQTDYSSIQQTVSNISSTVSTHTGQISTIQQNANSITTRVSNAEGQISQITQKSNSIEARINNTKVTLTENDGITVTNGGFKILYGSYNVFEIASYGSISMLGGLSCSSIFKVNPGIFIGRGEVVMGSTEFAKYTFSTSGTTHVFAGNMDIGRLTDEININSSNVKIGYNSNSNVQILGARVKWETISGKTYLVQY